MENSFSTSRMRRAKTASTESKSIKKAISTSRVPAACGCSHLKANTSEPSSRHVTRTTWPGAMPTAKLSISAHARACIAFVSTSPGVRHVFNRGYGQMNAGKMNSIDEIIRKIRERRAAVPDTRSLLVGVSGIDGCGKGYLARQFEAHLALYGVTPVI